MNFMFLIDFRFAQKLRPWYRVPIHPHAQLPLSLTSSFFLFGIFIAIEEPVLLLTEVHTWYRFPEFFPTDRFLFRDPIQDTILHLVIMPSFGSSGQTFLDSCDLDSFVEDSPGLMWDAPVLEFV